MTLSRVVLLRHGQTAWNAELRLQGHRDIPLDDTGLQQARAAAPSVAAMSPDVLVVSDLGRARSTAEPVAALTGLVPRVDARLRETSMGDWEGLTREEIDAGWPGRWDRWRSSIADVAPPGGENRSEVAARAAAVVDELDAEDDLTTALLVTHGGLILGLTAQLVGMPREHWELLGGVSNCHWAELERRGGRWRLRAWNAGLTDIVLAAADDEAAGV